MLDTLNRRFQFSREGTKVAHLRERDLAIFELLVRYRYTRSDFIHAFIGGDKTKLVQRLNELYRNPNCYLDRAERERAYFNALYRPIIYELDSNGEQALRNHGRYDPAQAVAWLRRGREGHVTLPHSVMICEALASIELGIREKPELRFIPWSEIHAAMPEKVRTSQFSHCLPANISHKFGRETHHSKKALMPDAVFGIEYPTGVRFFALECDRDHEPLKRSNLNQTSYLRKILQYQDVATNRTFKKHWGLPNLLVLNLTTSELHKNKIKDLVLELTEGKGASYLLFKTMPSLGDFQVAPATGHLLTEPWERAGRDNFRLDQS